jgi:hypothetical protein
MKRNNQVLNARHLRAGRAVARWVATGLNIGEGRALAIAAAQAALRDRRVLETIGRRVDPAEVMTQSAALTALYGWEV